MTIGVLSSTDSESLETPATAPPTNIISLKTSTAHTIAMLKYILRKIFECMDIFMSQYVAYKRFFSEKVFEYVGVCTGYVVQGFAHVCSQEDTSHQF